MTPEAARFLDMARLCLADATLYQPIVPRIAGREVYLAAYHAAEALIFERTGKIAKAHRGLRAQFARLARDEPSIDQAISEFLGRAYELKSLADYGTGTEAEISAATATAAVATASRFVDRIAALLQLRSIRRLTVSRTTVDGRSKIDIARTLRNAGATGERLPLWPGQ